MKKLYMILPLAAIGLSSCGIDGSYTGEMYDPDSRLEAPYDIDWNAAADSVDNVLTSRFMDPEKGTFWIINDNVDPDLSTYAYWPQAHAMDVIVDAYLRIRDTDAERAAEYENYMRLWHQNRAHNYNSPDYYNAYTDDMEWIVMTLLRMYEATNVQEYLTYAKQTYDDWIITRWSDDENGGGIRWSLDAANSKNACSNGPGAICAMRLYEFTRDEKYLDDAKRIYGWLSATLYNSSTGAVADNMSGGNVNGGALSYNQGTFMGAAHMLYKATGDLKYKTEAVKAAEYQMDNMTTDGIMNSETGTANSDNALFKGIFIRYAVLMANDEESFDAGFRKELADFITHNAITAWTEGIDKSEGSDMFFNYDWTTPYNEFYGYLQPQVSGSTLIEAMTRL